MQHTHARTHTCTNAHEDIISILNKLIDANKLPHLLLYGPPGTGKTSTIVAMARRIYGATKYKGMVLELNASDDRGIDVVRNQIKEFASTKQVRGLRDGACRRNMMTGFHDELYKFIALYEHGDSHRIRKRSVMIKCQFVKWLPKKP